MVDSPLEFPGDHPIRVMGRNTPEFRAQVLAVLAESAACAPLPEVAERVSRDGGFVSLSVVVRVASRAELDLLYRRLHATGLVLYSL